MPQRPAREFWRGRRVFLTGHTGFKGGWLVAMLNQLGAKTAGYALAPSTTPNFYAAAGIGELCQSQIGDIRDALALSHAIKAFKPEIVFHLAAQALVRPARLEPADTFSTNVMGTVNLLDAVRATPSVKATVVVTSDKVYDNVEWPWPYRETDALGGKEPYGASKACTEIVAQAYKYSYFNDSGESSALATARAGNVIGGGDWSVDRLVPDAMRAFSAGETLVIRNPASIRPWQHVLEPLAGYLRLAHVIASQKPSHEHHAFNFGPAQDDAAPVSAVADQLTRLWGSNAGWRHDTSTQPYEARLLQVDSSLAQSILGWQPKWRLTAGLSKTVEWYKKFHLGANMQQVTLDQVEEYLDG